MTSTHGHTEIRREGQIFVCQPQGGFNMEGAKEYEDFFAQEVEKIRHKPWAIIEVLEEFETGGPDVMKRIGAQFLWCARNNCCCLAVVSLSSLTKFIVEKYFPKADLEIRIFQEYDTARDWVNKKLHMEEDGS